MNKAILVRTSNAELFTKLNLLNHHGEVLIQDKTLRSTTISNILRNINRNGTKIMMAPTKNGILLRKVGDVTINVQRTCGVHI